MKKIIILLTALISFTLSAQDKIYVHTTTATNTTGHITYLDHPDLNGNPNANIVYKHVWNPNGQSGVFNNNIDGLWYTGSQWTIYNETTTTGPDMVLGAQFFIYIASSPSNVITHIASIANQYPGEPSATIIDDPNFNGNNPGPYAIMSHYWNPNSTYNNQNYGFFYDPLLEKRCIFSENGADIPTDAAFKILINGTGTISRFTHQATATNIIDNYTIIDHASLNNNPNATFVYEHYWGVNGSSNVILDKKLSAWYNGANWSIYTEDQSPMPEGIAFDIIVAEQEVLGAEDNEIVDNLVMYPNPASTSVTIKANSKINLIEVYSLLGQKVFSVPAESFTKQVDISNLTAGLYVVKVTTKNSQQSINLIKN